MIKLRIMSDLHLEFGPFTLPELKDDKDDILVLAGDIHLKTSAIPWIANIASRFKAVVYILGNHEFYGANLVKLPDKIREAIKATNLKNIYFLDNETVIIEDIRFIGSTLWSSFKNFDHLSMYHSSLRMNDYRCIKTKTGDTYRKCIPLDTARLHVRDKEFIEQELKKPHNGRTVVVTHHLPSFNLLQSCQVDELDGAYASNLDQLFDYNPDLWIFGHSHVAQVVKFANTLCVANCRGYAGSNLVDGFNPRLIINLGTTF